MADGSFLASATSSASVRAGTAGLTTTASGVSPANVTGCRSLPASYEVFWPAMRLTRTSAGEANSTVLPSAVLCTTACAPMVPAAPVRFSTMKFCPVCLLRSDAISRAAKSTPPPAG
ncbi:Uncharacterised protein [Bordetella pertussis]|nr:Uncharacterised protein [Bordetella pertussis]